MKFAEYFKTYPLAVVYDTEFTTWEGAMQRGWSGENEHRELVQIAAQKINLETEEVVDSFERLVRPVVNSELSEYFVDLTHVTQEQVNANGISFLAAYEAFLSWAGDSQMLSYSVRGDDYSDADVLKENIALYGLSVAFPKDFFGNLFPVFRDAGIDTTQYNSGKLYQAFGLTLDGHEHNAMHDVNSLVQSLFALKHTLKAGE